MLKISIAFENMEFLFAFLMVLLTFVFIVAASKKWNNILIGTMAAMVLVVATWYQFLTK